MKHINTNRVLTTHFIGIITFEENDIFIFDIKLISDFDVITILILDDNGIFNFEAKGIFSFVQILRWFILLSVWKVLEYSVGRCMNTCRL